MAKIFDGNCSIMMNGKETRYYLQADPNGQYNRGNLDELVKKLVELSCSKKTNAVYNFFIPQPTDDKYTGLTPVMLTGRGAQPYIAYLPTKEGATKQPSKGPTKIC